ncbi:sigma factor-like helix-turn-helix DNA-binding protein [Streptomyces sp. NPDC048664]|uniref:sigma factor-like helix-turn-helix DNA-binding protein n=1 Tax=Streptomyces sp. NPDC048664 TaxID=3154505 RepID=UPI0034164AC3
MKQSPASPLPRPKECRRLRRTQSLTQTQIASRLGVSVETVRDWETGLSVPRGRRRRAYARLLAEWAAQEMTTASRPEPGRHGTLPARPDGPSPAWTDPAPAPRKADVSRRLDRPVPSTLMPCQAFDALYEFCGDTLVRQTYLLTGRRALAREAAERAFQLAWQRWPEVARDPDPQGWVRAAAYEWALSPWHRFRPAYRRPEAPPTDPADRALLHALLTLPPAQRRTVVLYDGVGLDLPDTAAETQASTPASAGRLQRGRATLTALVPEQAAPEVLSRRLTELAGAEGLQADEGPVVRAVGEQRTRRWTLATCAFTALIMGATALTLQLAADHYERPVPGGSVIEDIPFPVAQGPLSARQLRLEARLRTGAHSGPERLLPQAR